MRDSLNRLMEQTTKSLAAWLNGRLPNTDAAYNAVVVDWHPEFTSVFPSGAVTEPGASAMQFRHAHGASPDFRIHVLKDLTRMLAEGPEVVAAEMIVLQDGALRSERPRHARRVTAVAARDTTAEHGLRLVRLHESHVPEAFEATLDWSAFD